VKSAGFTLYSYNTNFLVEEILFFVFSVFICKFAYGQLHNY